MSSRRGIIIFAVILTIGLLGARPALTGELSGTVNASYQRNEQKEIRNGADSLISRGATSEDKQSNIRLNYQDVLFQKNLMQLGATYYVQRDEIGARWNVRPIYRFDLSSDGYAYSSSYSPRTETSRIPMPNNTLIETRTFFRDWRNSLALNYRKLPPLTLAYNLSRNYDDQPIRETDRRRRYMSAQTSYVVGPASANVIYTNTKSENRRAESRTSDNLRTWQGSTGFAGSLSALGSLTASYSYLDSRSTRETANPVPATTTNVHSVAAMATSREWHKLTSNFSYSGRFLDTKSTGNHREVGDEDFSGQLSYYPLSYLSFSLTKNYHITSFSGGHQIGEYIMFSSSLSRFIRRGVDSRLNWTRTYTQQAPESGDTVLAAALSGAGSDNYTDAFYLSLATTPYRRAKLLADVSVTRANRPWVESQRYLSARSLSLSVGASRHIDFRLSASFSNQGAALDLLNSYARNFSAGITYLHGANLNGNLTFSRYSINTTPRQSTNTMNGYLGYSFRNRYSVYVYMNRSRQQTPTAGATNTGITVRKPRSWSAQLQTRLTPRSTLIFGYSWSAASVEDEPVSRGNTLQFIFHGQF